MQATGDFDDENTPNGMVTGWDYANEKFDMKVPERILVVGQDQHIGDCYMLINEIICLPHILIHCEIYSYHSF